MKRSLANYALFQGVWLAAVLGAAGGDVWLGLYAALGMLAVHLALVADRRAELVYVAVVAAAGFAVDAALHAAGLILYPTSEAWSAPTPPPWIAGLWLGFAMLPRFSLAWLAGRPLLAAVLGAVGGPLSFAGGVELGPIAPGSEATWLALGVEYAVLLSLMAQLSPAGRPAAARGPQPASELGEGRSSAAG